MAAGAELPPQTIFVFTAQGVFLQCKTLFITTSSELVVELLTSLLTSFIRLGDRGEKKGERERERERES
jgi:hypothetical protein